MTQAERTLDYLWAIAPSGATNAEIVRHLGAGSHQTVYMLMQNLLGRGLVRSERNGRVWTFYAVEEPSDRTASPTQLVPPELNTGGPPTYQTFETLAGRVLSEHYGVRLAPGTVGDVHKRFDFVSHDQQIVGDAKYYTRVRGTGLPPAKFATIAEHVWLLEKTGAQNTFLVFGNDREVPLLWLKRYGNLVGDVIFYLLTDDGRLEILSSEK